MKYLLLITLTFTLFSCGNDKQEIVDQIKVYKDSLTAVAREETRLTLQMDSLVTKYSDSLKFNFETKDLKELEQVNNNNMAISKRKENAQIELQRAQLPKRTELKVKRVIFESKIDSLELELKKY